MSNKINKLRIFSLENPLDKLNSSSWLSSAAKMTQSALTQAFEVQINPENISRNFGIQYKEDQAAGASNTAQFEKVKPETLEFKFILDGTGTFANNSAVPIDFVGATVGSSPETYVSTKIAHLNTVVYNYVDETHRTPFLMVTYGKMFFFGVFEEMNINYTMFNPSGFPLRAEITIKIKGQADNKTLQAITSFLSPDLTRQHTVIGSENILRICQEYYKDEKYYIELAKANGIINFRKTIAGQVFTIPPINKNSNS